MLSKSDYLRFLQCQRYLWLFKNKRGQVPEIAPSLSDQRTIEEGNEVESYARQLFPTGVLAEGRYQEAHTNTKALLDEGKKVIFQATVIIDELLAMADILEYDEEQDYWIINEVKSSTEVDDDHLADASFQHIAFRKAGFNIGKVNLIHINNKYVRSGDIDPQQLFTIEDITQQVKELESETTFNIDAALKNIQKPDEPTPLIVKQCNRGKTKQCPFIPHCWKNIPKYSIYDLNRISDKKLRLLLDQGASSIKDIPVEVFPLTEKQKNQVTAAHTGQAMIEVGAIKEELSTLEYPLYFLDYESFAPAIPLFDGYRPYTQMCFQYSLHVIEKQGSDPLHYEFLQKDYSDPVPHLVRSLREHIGDSGNVIVWNQTFEKQRNKEMAEAHPKYASFMHGLNDRMYDLMSIFTKQYYVHPDFKGSTSIKKVLPVLAPELSHADLEISEGATASIKWYEMVAGRQSEEERQALYQHLLDYCELDTYAMVAIYQHLLEL